MDMQSILKNLNDNDLLTERNSAKINKNTGEPVLRFKFLLLIA